MADRKVRAQIEADPARFEQAMHRSAAAVGRLNASLNKVRTGGSAGAKALNTQIQQLAPTLTMVGGLMTAMGAATVAAFTAATVAAGKYADEIGDFSATFGMATEDVRALNDTLGMADVSLQQFGMASMGVVDRLKEARQGNEEAAAAFRALGIDASSAEIQAMSVAEVMALVGQRLGQVADQQQRINLGKELGLGGRTLKAAIMAGNTGAAKDDPTFISDEQFAKLQQVSDELDRMGVKAGNTWKKAFAEAAPMVISLLGHLNSLLDWTSRFIDANPKLAGGIGMAVAAFGGLMSVLGPLLVSIAPIVTMMTQLSGVGGVGGLVKGLTTAIPLLGKVGPALAGIAPYAAVAVAAIGAVILVWRDLKVAIEAATTAWDAYQKRQQTVAMLEETGLSRKDAKRMARDDQAVVLPKGYKPGIRDKIIAEQRQQAGLPAMAAGGIVRQATLAMVGEAGPEAVVPLTGFNQIIAALSKMSSGFAGMLNRMPATGPGYGGGAPVTVNVSGTDTAWLLDQVKGMARKRGMGMQVSYGAP